MKKLFSVSLLFYLIFLNTNLQAQIYLLTSLEGYYDDNIYYNSPCDFIPNEHDWGRLEALRRMDIILAVGHDDSLRYSSDRLSSVLWNKGIGNALRHWDGWAHDWPWWHKMLYQYIGGHD